MPLNLHPKYNSSRKFLNRYSAQLLRLNQQVLWTTGTALGCNQESQQKGKSDLLQFAYLLVAFNSILYSYWPLKILSKETIMEDNSAGGRFLHIQFYVTENKEEV